jgi:pimeloyl-ACP methyl ester carboxylesterase
MLMKNVLLIIGLFLISLTSLIAQQKDFVGIWEGEMNMIDKELFVVIKITENNGEYKGTIDIPAQAIVEHGISSVNWKEDTMVLSVFGAEYSSVLVENGEKINGIWLQNGMSFPLVMERKTAENCFRYNRPQEPKPPFAYKTEDVVFENKKAGINLAGTLSIPEGEGPFPAVILVSGSGPQNRNEEIAIHKPFLVIADYLTINGYAVLRYDDRGVGESQGNFQMATTADFTTDALSAYDYLKGRDEIDAKKIGVCGHSEGGMVAQMMAAKLKKKLAFAIFLAGPGMNLDRMMLLQNEMIFIKTGVEDEIVDLMLNVYTKVFTILQAVDDPGERAAQIREVYAEMTAEMSEKKKNEYGLNNAGINASLIQYNSLWFRYFISYNPEQYVKKIKSPLLILNGENDVQVVCKENVDNLDALLTKYKHKDYTIKTYPSLNHLFQSSKTGMPSEYALIEETFSPLVLNDIVQWLDKRFKEKE